MTGRQSKATILCIEDEQHLRRDILDELAAAGYRAVGASDGMDGLAKLEAARPDLILCDISMPRLDGYAFLDTVRSQRPDLAGVPFIFLTAFSQRDEIISGKRAGADDYLVKPIDYDLMLATIEARLEQIYRLDAKTGRELNTLRDALSASRSDNKAGVRQVLDFLSFGIVLIEGTEIVFVNRAAKTIHDMRDGLAIDQALGAGSRKLTGSLKALLDDANTAAGAGNDYLASISVPRPSGQRDFLLTVCALPGAPAATAHAAQVAVFVSDPQQPPNVPSAVLAQMFGLTPTEADVARALALGSRTEQIAVDLGVSQTTIAFHLRNLFEKTGTHRQADLIVLILTGLASITSA